MIRKPALDRSNIVYFAKYESNCNVIIQIKLNTILAFLKTAAEYNQRSLMKCSRLLTCIILHPAAKAIRIQPIFMSIILHHKQLAKLSKEIEEC